jgi:DNA helicase-2/ATP-dependent DNA helicase PcrA
LRKANQNKDKIETLSTYSNRSSITEKDKTYISKASSNKAFIPSDLRGLKKNDEVFHEKFEKGIVQGLEGKGDNIIATIFFETHGQKNIMLKFAKLQILEK